MKKSEKFLPCATYSPFNSTAAFAHAVVSAEWKKMYVKIQNTGIVIEDPPFLQAWLISSYRELSSN